MPANIYEAIRTLITSTVPLSAEYTAQIPLPFARYVELGESYTYFTRSAADSSARQVWADSQFQISIFAATRQQARSLGITIMGLLDDYVVTYSDGRTVFLEPTSANFIVEPHTGPDSPTIFHRAITFSLTEQRTI